MQSRIGWVGCQALATEKVVYTCIFSHFLHLDSVSPNEQTPTCLTLSHHILSPENSPKNVQKTLKPNIYNPFSIITATWIRPNPLKQTFQRVTAHIV